MTPPGASDAYAPLTPRRRTLVTLALLACAFLAMLDGTVVGTALPRIVEQIGGSGSWYVWLVTAYLLTSSISVPVYGRFSDLYGRRRLLLSGLALFLAGSLACSLAGSMEALIICRAGQGLGAGALLTLGMALIRDLNPPSRTEGLIRMQTAMGTMMVLGLVGGPIVGGLLADHVGWRWAFWLNLPIGLAAAAVLVLVLPDRRPAVAPSGRLDIAGVLLLAAGLSLALTGLSLKGTPAGGRTPPWTDPTVAGCLLGGLVPARPARSRRAPRFRPRAAAAPVPASHLQRPADRRVLLPGRRHAGRHPVAALLPAHTGPLRDHFRSAAPSPDDRHGAEQPAHRRRDTAQRPRQTGAPWPGPGCSPPGPPRSSLWTRRHRRS